MKEVLFLFARFICGRSFYAAQEQNPVLRRARIMEQDPGRDEHRDGAAEGRASLASDAKENVG